MKYRRWFIFVASHKKSTNNCALLKDAKKNPSDTEIRDWLEGNICRCTGYQGIVAAVKDAASKM